MFRSKLCNGNPVVNFENCHLTITGNSYDLHVDKFYSQIISEINSSTCDEVTVDIDFEIYTSATIFEINKILKLVNAKFKKYNINWTSDDFFDIEVVEKLSGVKINFLQKDLC